MGWDWTARVPRFARADGQRDADCGRITGGRRRQRRVVRRRRQPAALSAVPGWYGSVASPTPGRSVSGPSSPQAAGAPAARGNPGEGAGAGTGDGTRGARSTGALGRTRLGRGRPRDRVQRGAGLLSPLEGSPGPTAVGTADGLG